jgi:3-oxoacyl-[acyl-carrier protein] reductase
MANSYEPPINPFDMNLRRALVTGAANGIGRQTSIRLAQAGAEVWCVDIDESGALATAKEIEARGGRATGIGLDVSDSARVRDVIGGLPSLHVVCNVAGILRHAPVETLSEAMVDQVLAVNLKSALFTAQAAFDGMKREGGGSIVNLASAAIDQVAPNLAAYAMSKAGIAQLTRNMAIEWAQHSIRVNAVAPGFVDTQMTAHSDRDEAGNIDPAKRAAHLDAMRDYTPLGFPGEPDDIANTVWFLASDASRFMTGQILRPNGGIAMPL